MTEEEGLRRRRTGTSVEGEDDPVTLGGAGGTRAIELDLSLNPNPGGQGRGNLPPLPQRPPSQRRRRQRQPRMEEFAGMRGDLPRDDSFDLFDGEDFRGEDDYSERSDYSAGYENVPESMTSLEVEEAVMMAIEAGKTRVLLRKLYWIAVSLLVFCGVLLVRTDFKVKWRKDKITDKMEIPKAIEGIFGLLIVTTIGFRSDFPFNISVLMASAFFSGLVLGIVFTRHSSEEYDDDE